MNYLRNVVSGPKARHVEKGEGVDLDLVYLTDRIILMGYPASGFEASYRNRMSDVVAFLDSKHRDCYRVFNLCPTSENSYPPTSFHGRVSRFPHPDHHPPPLPLLHAATQEMEAYLNASPGIGGKNVVVIHCKAGKGRTGTLACCLMERLGGVDAATKEHGMLNGRVEVPGSTEADLSDGEGDEGGSITGPTPTSVAPSPSEEPSVVSKPPLEPNNITPVKKARRSSKAHQHSAPQTSPPHPAAAAFAFHTARRMHNPQSVKQGVSIPSQRRFVRYYHSSLANLRSSSSSSSPTSPPSIYPGGSQHSSNPKPMLKLKDIIITQTSSANASLSLTPKVRGEAARYLDSFVSMLDDKVTENAKLGLEEGGLKPILEGAGGLGIGMSGVGTDEVGGEGEKGGAGMVRSLSKLSESYVEVGAKDIDEYGELTKTPLVTHHLTPDSPIVVHPDRELKIQVLHGENTGRSVSSLRARGFKSAVVNVVLSQDTSSLGWIWLVPSFHLPPPSTSPSTEPRTHTITFPRELVDFRSKSLRSIQLVFEEMPAPSPAPSLNVTTGGGEGEGKAVETEGKKGEVVPPEGERETADTKGINEADEGGEYK